MASVLDNFNFIPHKLSSERQWVVRASGGRFVKHFLEENIIASGHIKKFPSNKKPNRLQMIDIKSLLKDQHKGENELSEASITNHANQVKDFIFTINKGDLVITLDESFVAVGRVSGEAYIDETPVKLIIGNRKNQIRSYEMAYPLRRKVVWGPKLKRSELPNALEYTLRAHQTVFNIDKHWEYLYHTIYPIFRDEENLYMSAYIRQPENIESYHVSQLFGYLSDLEALSKNVNLEDIASLSDKNLYEILNSINRNINHELICKAHFFSEGTAWFKQPIQWVKDYRKVILILIGFQSLFGGKFLYIESPGLITPKMREDITKLIFENMKNRDMKNVSDELLLQTPSFKKEDLQKITPLINQEIETLTEIQIADSFDKNDDQKLITKDDDSS